MILGCQMSKNLDTPMHTCFGEDLPLEKYEMQEAISCLFKDCKTFEWKVHLKSTSTNYLFKK